MAWSLTARVLRRLRRCAMLYHLSRQAVSILACCMLFGVIAGAACLAQGLSVDWKFYGGAKLGDDASGAKLGDDGKGICFYDAKGIVAQKADGHIRVWTKCLLQKDLDGIDPKTALGGKIIESAAEHMAHYYVPPIVTVDDTIDYDKSVTIVMYEQTANIGNLRPQSSILYELNCSDQMLRELSIDLQINGKSGSVHKPRDWSYIPPESNAARLAKLLCRG